jgi:hypothetical protein
VPAVHGLELVVQADPDLHRQVVVPEVVDVDIDAVAVAVAVAPPSCTDKSQVELDQD